MKLTPLHDWAVIKPFEAEEVTAGGIVIPDTAKEKPAEGVVEAIGPGAFEEKKPGNKKTEGKERKFIPTSIKPGEYVIYEKYAGQKVTVHGEEWVLVRERDILGLMLEKPVRASLAALRTQQNEALSSVQAGVVKKSPAGPKKAAKAAPKAKKKTVKKAVKKAGGKSKKTAKKK